MPAKKQPKNSGQNTKKKRGNPQNLKPWKPGESGNPKGRPLGARDRRTVIWEALKRIAEKKNMTPEEIEEAIQVAGIEKAIKGSFLHYSEVSNGLYGKIIDNVDIKSGGKSLADLINTANARRRGTSKKTTRKDTE
ncbi:MAG: DUF5681 domain-containing protein [Bauldia litoralis]|uniref:DUF5681 domain-containing protein n=1 Tax=Bauldia litoralis TaxID=665467 RepID=UPI003298FE14